MGTDDRDWQRKHREKSEAEALRKAWKRTDWRKDALAPPSQRSAKKSAVSDWLPKSAAKDHGMSSGKKLKVLLFVSLSLNVALFLKVLRYNGIL